MNQSPIPAHTKRLAGKVNRPGGLTEDEAVAAATANMETLRGRTVSELGLAIAKIRAFDLQAPPDPAAVRALYTLSNGIVGLGGVFGMRALSAVAYSLCELIDRMGAAKMWNAGAVRSHVDSLVLMQGDGPGMQGELDVQRALRQLLERVPVPAHDVTVAGVMGRPNPRTAPS